MPGDGSVHAVGRVYPLVGASVDSIPVAAPTVLSGPVSIQDQLRLCRDPPIAQTNCILIADRYNVQQARDEMTRRVVVALLLVAIVVLIIVQPQWGHSR